MAIILEEKEYKEHNLKIYHDDFCEDPRVWDNLGI